MSGGGGIRWLPLLLKQSRQREREVSSQRASPPFSICSFPSLQEDDDNIFVFGSEEQKKEEEEVRHSTIFPSTEHVLDPDERAPYRGFQLLKMYLSIQGKCGVWGRARKIN